MPNLSFSAFSFNDYMEWRKEQVRLGGIKYRETHPEQVKAYAGAYRAQQASPALKWPQDLYLEAKDTTAPLHGKHSVTLCCCGCKQPHNNAVSKVVTEETRYGPVRKVLWFRSMEHRSKREK